MESENGIFEGCFALFCFVVLEGKEGLERMEKSVGKVLGFGCFGVLGFALFVFVFLFLCFAEHGCYGRRRRGLINSSLTVPKLLSNTKRQQPNF